VERGTNMAQSGGENPGTLFLPRSLVSDAVEIEELSFKVVASGGTTSHTRDGGPRRQPDAVPSDLSGGGSLPAKARRAQSRLRALEPASRPEGPEC
jgi:hypothetical protein